MKSDQAVDEQRKNRRLFMELKVGVAVMAGPLSIFSWRPEFEAKTQNVSARGLELLTDHPLAAQTAVKLWLHLRTGICIKLRGTVVRTSPSATTSASLCHISLSDRPGKALRIWEDTLFGNMRNFEN